MPVTSWRKADIINWLTLKNVAFPPLALKPELLAIVRAQKVKRVYAVDKIISDKDHTSLRLPPYHADLNPIEMVWAKIKQEVAAKNKTFKSKEVQSEPPR